MKPYGCDKILNEDELSPELKELGNDCGWWAYASLAIAFTILSMCVCLQMWSWEG